MSEVKKRDTHYCLQMSANLTPVKSTSMEVSEFGRTGHHSSRVIFGAAALWNLEWGQQWANDLLDTLTAAGVNHIDTAASYGDSELLLAPWLAQTSQGVRNRDHVFLATKTGERDGPAARAELERSLDRLGVDTIDLIQLHNLVEPDDWEQAHTEGGALSALVEARDEGLVRFIGVTGHGTRIPAMHLRSLNEFDYDSVLFPYNVAMLDDADYRRDVAALRDRCRQNRVAMQTIKAVARRRWPDDSPVAKRDRRSWYEPLKEAADIETAVRFVLSENDLFLNTSSDSRILPAVLQASKRPAIAPTEQEVAALRTRSIAALFDGAELERI